MTARGLHARGRYQRAGSWPRRLGWAATAVIVLGVAAVVAGFVFDGRSHRGRVMRHVSLGDLDTAGMTAGELRASVGQLAAQVAGDRIQVDAPPAGFTVDAGTLGLRLDVTATVDRVWRSGRRGWVGSQLFSWMKGWFQPRRLSPVITVDPVRVAATVAAEDPSRRLPVEPQVLGHSAGFVVVPGEAGRGIDTVALIAALPAAVDTGGDPVRVKAPRRALSPRFTDADAHRLATLGGQQISQALPVTAGNLSIRIPVPTLRTWVHSEITPTGLRLTLEPAATLAGLAQLLPGAGPPPLDTTFTVDGGAIRVAAAGTPGQNCCAAGAVALIQQALFGGTFPTPQDPPLGLPLQAVPPRVPAELVAKLGISQVIGTFTTAYDPGQPRVVNIQRMADLLKGWVILPGETMSLDTIVGPRTVARGFVPAQVIGPGHRYGTDVGGGISQFASTLLNAAYVGGLDIVERQSPSLYDPHEPFGRDATISFPSPDLKLRNASPYGIVVWTSHTDTSVTVTLYSTGYATGEQTAQRVTKSGACQKVHTVRTRTYVDGRTATDSLDALYYPGEGLAC